MLRRVLAALALAAAFSAAPAQVLRTYNAITHEPSISAWVTLDAIALVIEGRETPTGASWTLASATAGGTVTCAADPIAGLRCSLPLGVIYCTRTDPQNGACLSYKAGAWGASPQPLLPRHRVSVATVDAQGLYETDASNVWAESGEFDPSSSLTYLPGVTGPLVYEADVKCSGGTIRRCAPNVDMATSCPPEMFPTPQGCTP